MGETMSAVILIVSRAVAVLRVPTASQSDMFCVDPPRRAHRGSGSQRNRTGQYSEKTETVCLSLCACVCVCVNSA